jgi:hypothetical protein
LLTFLPALDAPSASNIDRDECRYFDAPIVIEAEGEIPMPKFVLLLREAGRYDRA